MIVDLFNKMCQNLHPDFLIYEVSGKDQMSQFGFLDKLKLRSRGLYQTYLAIPLKVFGVVAAVNRARIWGRELYQIYMKILMLAETLLVAVIMFTLWDSLSNQSSPSLETCLRGSMVEEREGKLRGRTTEDACCPRLKMDPLFSQSDSGMKKYISDWRCPSVPEQERQHNSRCYLPLLVSIGPIFHGLPQLKEIEDLKPEISNNFIQECSDSAGSKVGTYMKKFYDVAVEMKSYYSEEIRRRFTDEQFYQMLLLDVCFVVVVIHGIVTKNERNLPLSSPVLRMCLRDFFLLENQIPFLLVQDLVELRFGRQGTKIIDQFLSAVIHHPLTSNHMYKHPLHLLDLLRHTYIGIGQSPGQSSTTHQTKFFSAKQLHDRGVRFWAAVRQKIGYSIVEMEFDAGTGNLYMPPLLIDESFESIFLNIAAYEASRCDLKNSEVTTYLCLLQHLARDPESVSVLRKDVIRSKEDNSSIVKMFQRMCENLHPNFQLYDHLLSELQIFPSGLIASTMCWSRNPSTTHLVSRFFFTSVVFGTIIALADILSF